MAEDHPDLVRAIVSELRRWRWPPLRSVYIGGGTPALMSSALLEELLQELGRAGFQSGVEITLEANPSDIAADRLARWRGLGVTRLSVGIQTFDDAALGRLGRRHDGRTARSALELLARCWPGTWSVDLLVGWHGHEAARLLADLEVLMGSSPPHVSLYSLMLEKGSPLDGWHRAGRKVCLARGLQEPLIALGMQTLRAAGYEQYETSSFARPGHRCRHNQTYWRSLPYLGVGPGAAGFMPPLRWQNITQPRRYIAAARSGGSVRRFVEQIDPVQHLIEALALGLRTSEGVRCEDLDRRFSRRWRTLVDQAGDELASAGYLTWADGVVCVPEAHRLKIDAIVGQLVRGMEDASAGREHVFCDSDNR